MIIAKESSSTYTPAPEGVHMAVCVDVSAAFGVLRKKPVSGEEYKRDEVTIVWQIAKVNPDTGKRFLVRSVFGLSLSEKSKLRPFLEAWRGRKFTNEELRNGFDVEKLIGANCQLQIIHNGDWANVAGILPLPAGMPKMEPDNYTRKQDLDVQPAEQVQSAAIGIPDDEVPF